LIQLITESESTNKFFLAKREEEREETVSLHLSFAIIV